jgi:magnesium chelatase family protein
MADVHCNAQMCSAGIRQHCRLDANTADFLHRSIEQLSLSARAYHRILKIARTIADLEGAATITRQHVSEAVQYRRMESCLS